VAELANAVTDYTLPPEHALIAGATGSGKTTFVIHHALNVRPACRFFFDDMNRVWPRLKLRPAYTDRQLEESIPTRWSVFNHQRTFPGEPKKAFLWWCHWVFGVCHRGRGDKFVYIPEIWQWCTADSIPKEFATLAQAGRELGIKLILDTQRPDNVNDSIVGSATELVCFKLLKGTDALKAVGAMGADRDRVEALPRGSWISYNRLKLGEPGSVTEGRMF